VSIRLSPQHIPASLKPQNYNVHRILGKGGDGVDEHKLAGGIGWLSIGVGLALIAAPKLTVRAFGMGDRPNLGRFLGVRDLVIGAGLLSRQENLAPWLRARAVSDAGDATLLLAGALSGAFPRGRAMFGFAVASAFSVLGFALARRLE
jgi:hypothetical protein